MSMIFYFFNGFPCVILCYAVDLMTTLVIYGVCLLVSAVISSFIFPDTTKTKMPETLAESEKMAQSKFPMFSWYR